MVVEGSGPPFPSSSVTGGDNDVLAKLYQEDVDLRN